MNKEKAIDIVFHSARMYVREIGYDTAWVNEVSIDKITAQDFFGEYIWVVYSSGFKVSRLESLKKGLYRAYGDYRALDVGHRENVLNVINNKSKWNAVYRTAVAMQMFDWDDFKETYLDTIDSMMGLDFIGPKTKYHLARNLGFDVAKPDRWMCRLTEKLGWESVDSMCSYLSKKHDLKVKEIDLILWKYVSDLGIDGIDCTI